MIKNTITLLFLVFIVAITFKSMAYMGEHAPEFKKGLEQHLLRSRP